MSLHRLTSCNQFACCMGEHVCQYSYTSMALLFSQHRKLLCHATGAVAERGVESVCRITRVSSQTPDDTQLPQGKPLAFRDAQQT